MARASTLEKKQLGALDRLTRARALSGLVLVGGGAIGFRLGHRRSRDIELFTYGRGPRLEVLRRRLTRLRGARVVSESDATLALELDGVAIDVVEYPYPLLEPPVVGPGGVPTASLRDLGPMKLAAIARRGLRRDFWDVYAIVQAGTSLSQMGRDYVTKYGRTHADLYHVARALTYFDDAEREDALPEGMTPALWRTIRRHFQSCAPRLLEEKG